MSDAPTCPDCAAAIPEDQPPHCPACGQRLALAPLTAGAILGEFVGALLSFELPILRTGKDLLIRGPGAVAGDWVAGRRQSYVSPIKTLLLLGVVIALTYGPIQTLRRSLQEVGSPTYETGFVRYAPQYLAFLCVGILLPVAWVTRWVGLWIGLRSRSWVEWYALALFAYALGIAVQLVLQVVLMPLNLGGAYRFVEGTLPAIALCLGAAQFVQRGFRLRAVLLVLVAQGIMVVCVAGARELFMMAS